jgi:ribosomal protein L19E
MSKEEYKACLKAFDQELHLLQKQMEIAFQNYREIEKAYQSKQLEKVEFLCSLLNQFYNAKN